MPNAMCLVGNHELMALECLEILIKAEAYARSVEILNEDDALLLSDNYFDMNAGEKRIRIIKGEPNNLKIRSVYDIR